jgi:hypothetical protein
MPVYFIRHATNIEAAKATAVVTTTRVFPSIACCAIAVMKAAKKATSVTMPTRTIGDRLFCSLMRFPLRRFVDRRIARNQIVSALNEITIVERERSEYRL